MARHEDDVKTRKGAGLAEKASAAQLTRAQKLEKARLKAKKAGGFNPLTEEEQMRLAQYTDGHQDS